LKKHRNITLLGSTGSIGCSTLEVLSHLKDYFSVASLSTNRNIALLEEQILRHHPKVVAVIDEERAAELRRRIGTSTEVLSGEGGLIELAGRDDSDIVLNALVGFSGLRPTLRAIETGKDIAIANKETLVVAGDLVTRMAKERGVRLLPIDSEHSAILQCLQGENIASVTRLIITASGGPFLHHRAEQLESVTVAEALNHPTWKMGPKVTIDSATLMNKGLEVIEACRLFNLSPDKIQVLVHPQSIIHSLVEFDDGSVKAQLGMPDMRLPIQYALMYPERPPAPFRKIDFRTLSSLTFKEPDTRMFRCLPLAFQALRMGGTAPAVLNAANEVAVQLFLEERIPFTAIADIVGRALDSHEPEGNCTLDQIIACDRLTRESVLDSFRLTPPQQLAGTIEQRAAL
jgi:1-deoxy-D-xylulose-5-phosphate reductoisomerase